MRGKIIVFSGPSGVGKGTIRKNLKFNDYVFSISLTTREPRHGEIDGVHYYFVSHDYFLKKVNDKKMLEHAEFVGNYYGTDIDNVNYLLDQGKNVFLEIECQGALQVLEKIPDAISIFIVPPSLEELKNRLLFRGTEDENKIKKRLNKAKEEFTFQGHYKYVVVNDNLDHVVKEVDQILYSELSGKNNDYT